MLLSRLAEIIENPSTGKLSNTKLATSTAYLVGTYWFCWHNYHSGFTAELWLIYYGVAASHQTASKAVTLLGKRGQQNENIDTP